MAENKWGFTGVMTHPEISGVKGAPTSKLVGAHFVEIPHLNIQVLTFDKLMHVNSREHLMHFLRSLLSFIGYMCANLTTWDSLGIQL